MKKLPVAVCLGHKDLDFTFGLDRSDDFLLLFWLQQYFNSREKNTQPSKSLTDIFHFITHFLKRLNTYHDISHIKEDQ